MPDGVTLTVSKFGFAGNSVLDESQLTAAVREWTGRPIGFADLQRAAAAVANAYRARGWIVRSYLPEQDVTEGLVTIQVIESRFGGARFEGRQTDRLKPEIALRHVEAQQATGALLSAAALDRALLLVDDLPGAAVAGALEQGARHGETLLDLRLQDDSLWDGVIGADNGGARSTGSERILATAQLNSPLRIGDRARADVLVSEGARYARLGYSLPLGADGLRVAANVAHFDYDLVSDEFEALDAGGDSTSGGVELTYPLIRSRLRNLYLTGALDERRFDNEANATTQSHYAIRSGRLEIAGNQFDGFAGGGSSTATLGWVSGSVRQGTPDVGENPAVDGSFNKLVYSLARQQILTQTLAVNAALSGQYTSDALDSAERFYLGGPEGVRAYPVNEGGGSRSEMINLELRWRALPTLTAIGFHDFGRVRNFSEGASYTLKGYGVSLEWLAPYGLRVEGTYALRQGANPNPGPNGAYQDGSRQRNRVWLRVSLPFQSRK